MKEQKNAHLKINKTEYNEETIKAMDEAKEMAKNSKNYKSFNNIEDLIKDLNN